MDFKKSLKDVAVLVAICAVFATVLAFTNSITGPIIREMLEGAANEAYNAVIPGATGFEDVDLAGKTLPPTVVEAKREKSGLGYAIKLDAKGYATGMIIIVGVDNNGVVTGATCVTSNETWGLEKTLGEKFVGKDVKNVVDVEAGATSFTVNGYRSAVKDAINAATILSGGSADLRSDEEILRDNLMAALPEGGDAFTKVFMVEVTEGIDKIYSADNGKGYVCVIGEEFIGVDADGVALGESENNAIAEAAVAIVSATEIESVEYTDDSKNSFGIVTKVEKTATGNYIFTINMKGHGIKGDEHAYPSGKPSVIMVSISADGVILDTKTLENNESENWGGPHLKEGAFSSSFIGKTNDEANGIDFVAESTNTTKSYKYSILHAFEVYTILVGGTTNE